MEVEASSSPSVAELRKRLTMTHIRPGPPQPPSSGPVAVAVELPGSVPSQPTPRQKAPPPPLPSGPPRRPSAPSLPPRRPSAKDMSSYQQPTEEDDLPSPPAYAPPLPDRNPPALPSRPPLPPRSSSGSVAPRARPTPPPVTKPKPFSRQSTTPVEQKPRPLPPIGAAVPVIAPNSWGQNNKKAETPRFGIAGRKPSIPSTPARSADAESPVLSRPPIPPPQVPLRSQKSVPSLPSTTRNEPPPPLPVRTPTRSTVAPELEQEQEQRPPPRQRIDIRSLGFGGSKGKLPSPPRTPEHAPTARPPPVPIGNRPAASMPTVNLASKPKFSQATPVPVVRPHSSMPHNSNEQINRTCLKCRDFTHVDEHAAKFPRHAYDDIQRLALDLTAPFGSATDKARAIFTWLHHNVRYDVDAFFGNRVQPSTPASTLRTGLAVCEGFAGLFVAMAVYAGLEAIVVGGHGKGYGWDEEESPVVPPFKGNHAWNAVRIDGGGWHLVDPCWGAGNVEPGKYNQVFAPEHFTMTNEEFRERHFPENSHHQFCSNTITWDEYFLMKDEGPVMNCVTSKDEYGFGKKTVEPYQRVLRPHTRYRFRVTGRCDHVPATTAWILEVKSGEAAEYLRPDGRGGMVADLTTGPAGTRTEIHAIIKFNGQSAKGMTIEQFVNATGARSWSFMPLFHWEVA
ncbi:hypothetical protein TWF694_011845 [Orbilia ellipsospora]|uniref:Transglutaminase-like domain-containing protein n=1 Tax=Orbilia ellipsospora TaxID=2528407 RepID=A0AAV9X7N8_9PEZI